MHNIDLIEDYFRFSPEKTKSVGDLFQKNTYEKLLTSRLESYQEKLKAYINIEHKKEFEEIKAQLRSRNAFTRNQLNEIGRRVIGGSWDTYYRPFVNHHYWELLSKLMDSRYSANDLAAGSKDPVISAIAYTMNSFPIQLIGDVKFDDDPSSDEDGYDSEERFDFDWEEIISISISKEAKRHLEGIRSSERRTKRERATDKYLSFLSSRLGRLVDIERDDFGSFTVKAVSTDEQGNQIRRYRKHVILVRKVIPFAGSVLGPILGVGTGYAYGGISGSIVGGLAGKIIDGTLKSFVDLKWVRGLNEKTERDFDIAQWRKLKRIETLSKQNI